MPSASKINDLPPQLTDKLDGDQKMPSVELDDSLNTGPNPVTQDLEPDPNRLDAPEWLFNQVLQQRSIPSSPPPVDDSGSPISKAIYAVHLAYKRSFPNSNNLVPPFMEFIARINCDDQSLDDENTPSKPIIGFGLSITMDLRLILWYPPPLPHTNNLQTRFKSGNKVWLIYLPSSYTTRTRTRLKQ